MEFEVPLLTVRGINQAFIFSVHCTIAIKMRAPEPPGLIPRVLKKPLRHPACTHRNLSNMSGIGLSPGVSPTSALKPRVLQNVFFIIIVQRLRSKADEI